ncbi:MAG: NADH-quinone oxidoreductase subunit M [Planctomycetes bacterium]|nr:NADH-quinone oxidoreductase subunit M [Planctomycetota bacterium]
MMSDHLLSLVTFLPLAAALGVALVERRAEGAIRGLSLLASVATFVLSLGLWAGFDPAAGFQFLEDAEWIAPLGARYHVGVDGLSLVLVLLTTLLSPLALAASWRSVGRAVKEFHVALLVLETAMLGVFVARDLLLFYVFWEAMLIPMYLLIGVWGGPGRFYAALKFFVYTLAGSVCMLVGIVYLYVAKGSVGFDLGQLASGAALGPSEERWLYWAFALAFMVKVPLFPFHTWLPDAHVEAPTAGSVLLAGVLLKMGAYGFLRLALPLFPTAFWCFAPLVAALAIVGVIYGALMALAQEDLKRLIAYSSVSHLGFVMLGIASGDPLAASGGVYQMLNHGVSTGALFLLVGVLYERRHTRLLGDFGGLAAGMPRLATAFLLIALSSIGLPGLNGFAGEFLVLLGTFQVRPLWAATAGLGVVLGAVYMLRCYQRVFHGEVVHEENRGLADLDARELACLAPLGLLTVVMGLFPGRFLAVLDPTVRALVEGGGP